MVFSTGTGTLVVTRTTTRIKLFFITHILMLSILQRETKAEQETKVTKEAVLLGEVLARNWPETLTPKPSTLHP